jgi:hypothetical protein
VRDIPDHEREGARAFLATGALLKIPVFQYREWATDPVEIDR